jgi:hypothetical protein
VLNRFNARGNRRTDEIGRDYFFDSPRVPRCAVAAKILTGYGARRTVKVSRAWKAYRVTAAIARNPRTQPHELRP